MVKRINNRNDLKQFFAERFNYGGENCLIKITALERHLGVPDKLITNWLRGVKYRSLGDYEQPVIDWAVSVGFPIE